MRDDPSIPLVPVLVVLATLAATYFLILKPLTYHAPLLPPGGPLTPVLPQPQVKVKLYLFTQDGCPPCERLHKSLQDPEVRKVLAARFDLQTVRWPSELFEEYRVRGTPTLVAVTRSGPKSKSGSMPPAKLREWLESL